MHVTKHIARWAIVAAIMACGVGSASAELLFSDNFNTPATALDNDNIATRTAGTLAGDSSVWLQSSKAVQYIESSQLSMRKSATAKGRARFGNIFDWSAGATGTSILADGGMRIEFDWTTPDAATADWIAFDFGFDTTVEPDQRVNNAWTDYGILFRGNGGVLSFDNGTSTGDTTDFTATTDQQHVILDFAFTSFATGSAVQADVWVGGTKVDSHAFTFAAGDGGGTDLNMEIETALNGMLIDNYSVSTIPEPATMSLFALLGGGMLYIRKRLAV